MNLSSIQTLEIIEKTFLLEFRNLMRHVEYLASQSPCPELKVAYVLTNTELNKIAYGINGFCETGGSCKYVENIHDCVHAEDRLCRYILNENIDTDGLYAIGNYSPCSKCIEKLWGIGINTVIFNNFHRDIFAIEKARKLDMELYYYNGFTFFLITKNFMEPLKDFSWWYIERVRSTGHNPSSYLDIPR